VRADNYLRRINTLSRRIKRLEKKNRLQLDLIKMLQKDVSHLFIIKLIWLDRQITPNTCAGVAWNVFSILGHAGARQLDSIDASLTELLRNASRNSVANPKGRRYSQNIRCFAFTIYYYSPKAYRYLRSMLTLPSPRLIRSWMASVDLQPGFLTEQFDRLSTSKPYSFVFDSMSIRKRQVLDKSEVIHGNVNFGGQLSTDDSKVATEVLVFLLVPITGGDRVPCAYFLVDKADANVQASLIRHFLTVAASRDIDILSLTCDGCPANIATLRKLGAVIPDQPWFRHPTKDQKVSLKITELLVTKHP
jgi:hypothetical protein